MDVFYDVANLGIAFGTELTRTGIFRATESFVKEALSHPALNARFAAMDSYASEIQLARYDRSVHGRLGNRRVSAWTNDSTTELDSIDLVDRLFAASTAPGASPQLARLRAEIGLLNRTARARTVTGDFDIYHSWRQPLVGDRVRARARVVTIYDMVPFLFPQLSEERFVALHNAVQRSIDHERDWVICNSLATRADISEITGMADDRIFSVPLAASPTIFRPERDAERIRSVLVRHGIADRRYVLSLCTLEPRKNLTRLVNAFSAMADAANYRDVQLVLVGSVGWKASELFERIEAHRLSPAQLVLPGFVPDEELSALYSGASLFVYPSLHEGFGLPVLEAMQCGTPVITSNTSSLPEVVGESAIMIDPRDEEALSQAIREVLDDSALANRLARSGLERAQLFTWRRTVEETLIAYRRMLAC